LPDALGSPIFDSMTAEDLPWIRATRSFARTAFRHRCPACAEGRLFRGRYELFDRCSACGQDLAGVDGAHYGGPIVLGYTVAGVSGLGTVLVLWWRLGYATWQLWASIAVTCAAVFLTFRHCKAAWVWLLWATGQLGGAPGDPFGDRDSGPGRGPDDGPDRRRPPSPAVRVRWRVRLGSRTGAQPAGVEARDP
jgi:uncharacterized protein (DUF983 family)